MECDESFEDFVEKKYVLRRKVVLRQKPTKKKKKCTTETSSDANLITCSAPQVRTECFNPICELQTVKKGNSTLTVTAAEKENMSPSSNTKEEVATSTVTDSALHCDSLLERNEIVLQSQEPSSVPQSSTDDDPEQQISSSVESNWLCIICGSKVPLSVQDSHLQNCIRTYGHKQESVNKTDKQILSPPLKCSICDVNITHFSLEERSEHVNKCLDSKIENVAECSSNNQMSAIIITECPLCFKNCNSVQNRLAHIKKCSKSKNMGLQNVIVALELQKKHAIERISLGLPLLQTNIAEKKINERLPKKVVREPKSQVDADIQLAKALSLSFREEEMRKDLLAIGDKSLDEICMSKKMSNQLLRAPSELEKPGKKKKKNANNKPVPILLLRTDEERQKLFEERISVILAARGPLEGVAYDSSYIPENCPLWTICGMAEDKMSYYVPNLVDFVVPDDIEAGSKLRDLSQVPGHHVYTQKPCDFTFSDSQENKVDIVSTQIPSTQEIVNMMTNIEQETSTLGKMPCSESSQNETHGKDGFFCENLDEEVGDRAIVKLLGTLVCNEWMSDVGILVADGSTIPAHSLLLQLRCPPLRQILGDKESGSRKLLDWHHATAEDVKHFLHYVYTGNKRWTSISDSEIARLALLCGIDIPVTEFLCESFVSVSMPACEEPSEIDTSHSFSSTSKSMSPPQYYADEVEVLDMKVSSSLEAARLESFVEIGNLVDEDPSSQEDIAPIEDQMEIQTVNTCFTPDASTNRTLELKEELLGSPDLFACDTDDEDTGVIEDEKSLSSVQEAMSSEYIHPIEFDTTIELKIDSESKSSDGCTDNQCSDDITVIGEHNHVSFSRLQSFSVSLTSPVAVDLPPFISCSENEEVDCLTQISPPNRSLLSENEVKTCISPSSIVNSGKTVEFQKISESIQKWSTELSVDNTPNFHDAYAGRESESYYPSTPQSAKGKNCSPVESRQVLFPVGSYSVNKIVSDAIEQQLSPANSIIVLSSDEEDDNVGLRPIAQQEKCEVPPKDVDVAIDAESGLSQKVFRKPSRYEYFSSEDEMELLPLSQRIKKSGVKQEISRNLTSEDITSDADLGVFSEEDYSFLIESKGKEIPKTSCSQSNTKPSVSSKALKTTNSPAAAVCGELSNSPVTPLPDYKAMFTPEIKGALKRYGIRALPKKKAIALLNHIYDETHPWVDSNGCVIKNVEAKEKITGLPQKQKPVTRKRKGKEEESSTSLKKKKASEGAKNVKSTTAGTSSAANLSSSQSSRSDLSDLPEEIYEMNSEETCSQATYNSRKDQIFDLIRSDKYLYSKILMYEPLVLNDFHADLKGRGIKISTSQLMDFLDEECITFTLPRSEKYKKKQQARSQKFRKKMIDQLSQPIG